MPRITVLMPAYNAEKHIEDAIDSVLGQTYSDFELIVLDDSSCDSTTDIVSKYDDKRISLVRNKYDTCFLEGLNRRLTDCDSQIFSRMDSDDICDRTRFQKQITYIENNSDIGVVGASTFALSENNVITRHSRLTHPITHHEIKASTIFGNPIINSSTLVNFKSFDRKLFYYDISYFPSSDYECWFRLLSNGVKFRCIEEYLHTFRYHVGQLSYRKKAFQKKQGDKIRLKALQRIGLTPSPREMTLHLNFIRKKKEDVVAITKWLDQILDKNYLGKYYKKSAMFDLLLLRIQVYMNDNSSLNADDRNFLSEYYSAVKCKYGKFLGA